MNSYPRPPHPADGLPDVARRVVRAETANWAPSLLLSARVPLATPQYALDELALALIEVAAAAGMTDGIVYEEERVASGSLTLWVHAQQEEQAS